MANKCISCSTKDNITHHHIVPRCFSEHLTTKYTNLWNSKYNKAWLCRNCHDELEEYLIPLQDKWLNKYNLKPDLLILSDTGSTFYKVYKKDKFYLKNLEMLQNRIVERYGRGIDLAYNPPPTNKEIFAHCIDRVIETGSYRTFISDYHIYYNQFLKDSYARQDFAKTKAMVENRTEVCSSCNT